MAIRAAVSCVCMGLSANCRSFDRFVPVLAEAGHHVVTMDLRGRGRSERDPRGSYGWDSRVPRSPGNRQTLQSRLDFVVMGHWNGWFHRSCRWRPSIRGGAAVSFSSTPWASPKPSALPPIMKSVGHVGGQNIGAGCAVPTSTPQAAVAPWDEFWDSYFGGWKNFDDTVRIRTDFSCGGRGQRLSSIQQQFMGCGRERHDGLLVPGQQAHDSRQQPSQKTPNILHQGPRTPTVVDVNADHYSILISPRAISAVEQFGGRGRRLSPSAGNQPHGGRLVAAELAARIRDTPALSPSRADTELQKPGLAAIVSRLVEKFLEFATFDDGVALSPVEDNPKFHPGHELPAIALPLA